MEICVLFVIEFKYSYWTWKERKNREEYRMELGCKRGAREWEIETSTRVTVLPPEKSLQRDRARYSPQWPTQKEKAGGLCSIAQGALPQRVIAPNAPRRSLHLSTSCSFLTYLGELSVGAQGVLCQKRL